MHPGRDDHVRGQKGGTVKNLIDGMMNDAMSLLIGALILMAVAFVIMTWGRTKSVMPTIGALLVGAFIITMVTRYKIIQDEVDEDLSRYTTTNNTPLEDQGDR
jgi:hypothetical protein